MAATKSRPAKGKKPSKKARGRMPVKRSINLVLIDENKINPVTAILSVLLILVLAAAFSKFLVIDRLNAVSAAQAKAARIEGELDSTLDQIEAIGDIEDSYAHYTIDSMTAAELGLVDRVEILELVHRVLIANATMSTSEYCERVTQVAETLQAVQSGAPSIGEIGRYIRDSFSQFIGIQRAPADSTTTWSLTGNVLTVNAVGRSLKTMNDVAKMLEEDPIVDSCVLTTANKSNRTDLDKRVSARFIVYLQQSQEVNAQ